MDEQTVPFRAVIIQLGAVDYTVASGDRITVPFAISNQTGVEDYFDITVQGVPEGWVLQDMPVMRLTIGERRESSFAIQTPGNSPLSAGMYPVTIRAASQANPDWAGEAKFQLRVDGLDATRPASSSSTIPFSAVPFGGQTSSAQTYPAQQNGPGGRIGLEMGSGQFSIAPGERLVIPFTLINRGMLEDTFFISVEGLAQHWVSLPMAAVHLFPGEQRQLSVGILPPQSPDSRAGRHPFAIRVVSQMDASEMAEVSSVLTVTAISQFAVDLNPRRINAGQTARLRIHNLSNIQETYQVSFQSQDDNLDFVPTPAGPVNGMPGETVAVDFVVNPRSPGWFGGNTPKPYTVLVQSAGGDGQSIGADVITRAMIPIWVIPALLTFCLTAVCGFGFLWNWNQNRQTGATQTAVAQAALFDAQTATAAVLALTPSIPPLLTPTASGTPELSPTPEVTATGAASATPAPVTLTPITPTATFTAPPPTSTLEPTIAPTLAPPTATNTAVPVAVSTATVPPFPVAGQQLILFAANSGGQPQIILLNSVDGTQRPLTDAAAANTQPAWSPDGARVAFTTNRDGNFEIYVMNADGSSPVNLTRSPADDTFPAWSPDGTKIVFTTNRDGNNEIYSMNADGSNPVNLTKSPANDVKPVWYTQSGLLTATSRIVFATDRDGHSQIYAMNTDGASPVNLSKSSANDTLPTVPWAGGQIAFVSDRDGNSEIYEMALDGGGQTNRSNSPSADSMPVWSPDGKWIAFISNRGGPNQVYLMAADGSQVTNVSRSSTDNQFPAWH